jgi:hypothetical protein
VFVDRPLIHVGGPPGAGKTTFVEAVLTANEEEPFIVVRGRLDPSMAESRADVPTVHAEGSELHRYEEADAMTVAEYFFPEPVAERFFGEGFLHDFPATVVIEGDNPVGFADLSVYVMTVAVGPLLQRRAVPPLSPGPALQAMLANAGAFEELAELLLKQAKVEHAFRVRASAKRQPAAEERWTVVDEHRGIERCQLVIVNVRDKDERERADAVLTDLARLRQDAGVFADLRPALVGGRTPITAVIADLTDRKDPGTRKALARVRRLLS